MQRLLVTGASGFLGSRIVLYYKDRYEVIAPTHSEMDITDAVAIEKFFDEIKPDVVVHCAAISDTGRCQREPEKSFEMNVRGSVNVASAAWKIGAKCIMCSSDQVYFGSKQEEAHNEDEILVPCTVYGRDKLIAEQECLKAHPECICLRLSWMYDTKVLRVGEHGNFMSNFMDKVENADDFEYAIHDVRGITDVNEVVLNLEKLFHAPGGIYNFGSPNDKNMYDTMKAVFHNLGLDISKLKMNETAFKDSPRNMSMCQKKAVEQGVLFSTTIDNLTKNIGQNLNICER